MQDRSLHSTGCDGELWTSRVMLAWDGATHIDYRPPAGLLENAPHNVIDRSPSRKADQPEGRLTDLGPGTHHRSVGRPGGLSAGRTILGLTFVVFRIQFGVGGQPSARDAVMTCAQSGQGGPRRACGVFDG